jgi:hypothetical protein
MKYFVSFRSPTEHKNGDFRHAGMDCRYPGSQERPETSMSAWISALHAGMTQSRSYTKLNQRHSTPHIFKGDGQGFVIDFRNPTQSL